MKVQFAITCIITVFSLCNFSYVSAQKHKQSFSAHWEVVMPVGASYIKSAGIVNPMLEWNYIFCPALTAGVSLGYRYAADRGVADEYVDQDLVSGYRVKTQSQLPLLVKLRYYPIESKKKMFSPYVGVGAGVQYAKYKILGDVINSNKTANWAELFSAELGSKIYPSSSSNFYFDARFSWQYGGNKWQLVHLNSTHTVGFSIGVGVNI